MCPTVVVLTLTLVASGCGEPPATSAAADSGWIYQLQGYPGGRLDEIAARRPPYAVIDLARDNSTGYFRADEIAALRAAGTTALAYFEIGSIENFRPDFPAVQDRGLLLNEWPDWPGERFGRYWEPAWWDTVVRPRLDRALAAGFDGAYLDTPLAYEEIDLARVPGWDRGRLARAMADLVVRISRYAKAHRPGFRIVPQNSPELRHQGGYTEAIDGVGVEELFYQATDVPCEQRYCAENLADVKALRDGGKFVLAVDYAVKPEHVQALCTRYRKEQFAGYVGVRELDRIGVSC
ncbi:cysteinyl-tRNA synthetase [Hamadaea flava]|uniref:Endo alpha-1,4 polygalactosaminidase n=1 Tax=Hamadaea flava TaxID=1742688 RepID=A0ABV8LR53_9ACTN|nr:endo alpha-1,4 polygalactosaminidase [Hamadaea flava]MCP2323161.1 cysteinyl-tRNA synthetase [Hamadaea flava]